MKLSECKRCQYCRKLWSRDRFGNFTDEYYACQYPPHWTKRIETIVLCPKEKGEVNANEGIKFI